MGDLYWSILALVAGGCVGSFLNVVIFRWPRGLSIRRPSRSFCPACERPIAWYDNIPVASYLVLRGRCRRCGSPISLQYPLVELATGLVFLVTYDAFFVARQRLGIGNLGVDWPLLLAHWGLWAGLIVLAVMDLEAYLVDVRVTWVLLVVGLAGHSFWAPAASDGWIRPGAQQAGWAIAVAAGLAIGWWFFLRRQDEQPPVEEPPPDELSTTPAEAGVKAPWAWLILPIAMVAAYLVVMLLAGEQAPLEGSPASLAHGPAMDAGRGPAIDKGAIRLAVGLVAAFLGLALAASRPQPEADSDIVEAIKKEAPAARRNALWELKLLTPAILLGAAVLALLVTQPAACERAGRWLHWQPAGQWQPLWGLATALTGWVIGGAVGWIARIGFTLLFSKEALGMGDVHILAAAGAIAGWPVAFMGFFLAAPLTLLALVVIHLRRQSRALPYGPWLALAFLLASMFQDRIFLYLRIAWLFEGS